MERISSAIARLALAALIAIAFGQAPLRADDGSWSTSFRESGGPVYSETPNADIALDAELLRFTMRPEGLTQAVFQFRNTSSRTLDVEAGFPIDVSFNVGYALVNSGSQDEATVFTLAKYRYEPEVHGLAEARAFLGDAITFDEKFGSDSEDPDGPNGGAWLLPASAMQAMRTVRRGDFKDPFSFSILQDGRKVEWDYVVLDQSLEKGEWTGLMTLYFHFHHLLHFTPKSTSIVTIVYSQETLRGGEPTAFPALYLHGWDYILGTGGTWKGPIGKLLLCLPADAEPTLPAAFQPLGINGREKIFLAQSYRPAEDDRISLKRSVRGSPQPSYFEQLWFGASEPANRPAAPAQDFVKVRGASSFLGDKTTVYTPEGVIKDMDFSPLRLVDGVLESSWVEGAKGDGMGEWVELELSRDVAGMEIQNGFSMSRTAIKGKNIDTFYEKNNRVKELLYESKDGATRGKIKLEDTNDHLQSFPLALRKGIYRFTIGSVYKGSKWDDTCLGEIVFLPASEALAKVLAGDDFLRKAFPLDDPKARPYGALAISAATAGTLYLDGTAMGELPAGVESTLDDIAVGERVVELRYAGGQKETKAATVQEGRSAKVAFGWKSKNAPPAPAASAARAGFVLVPGGSFAMGPRQVTLSGFSMGKYEVTQAQYKAVTGTNPSNFKGDNLPVEQVTWYDAVEFCNKLSAKDRLTPVYAISGRTPALGYPITSATVKADLSKNGYRLPTEAQWEYAARGGQSGAAQNVAYAGSDTPDQVAWYDGNSGNTTHPVGGKAGNALGLYDMSGNVLEWCWDVYGDYSSEAQTDPTGASSGADRVLRGGSWGQSSSVVTSEYRNNNDPYAVSYYIGFRICAP
jgi:formylglycine-generating enzyme